MVNWATRKLACIRTAPWYKPANGSILLAVKWQREHD